MKGMGESAALERFELLERIGIGGMGEVFRARVGGAHGFEKLVALKRILPRYAQDAEFEARFIAEAKLAGGLSHANLIQQLAMRWICPVCGERVRGLEAPEQCPRCHAPKSGFTQEVLPPGV